MSNLVEMKPRSVNLNASNVSKNINDLKSDGILQTLTDYVKEREIIYHVISYASRYVRCMQSIAFMPERD
jgi:DNA-binding MarR family transcriptional regulator